MVKKFIRLASIFLVLLALRFVILSEAKNLGFKALRQAEGKLREAIPVFW